MVYFFPDPESPIVNILYGWSGIYDQFGLRSFMFSFVKSSELIILVSFFYIVTFNIFFFAY